MRSLKLIGLTALALLAFGTVGTTMAGAVEAEEENKPQVLCFVENCIGPLRIPLSGGKSTLETLGGLMLEGESVAITMKNCIELEGSKGKDGNLCEDQDILFIGMHKGAQKCNTEGLSAEKGEVLALLDVHYSAQLTTTKELQPLLLSKILDNGLKPELLIKCGVTKSIVRGAFGCLVSPGLTIITVTGEVTVKCEINKTTHDRVSGTCNVLCTEFENAPFESKLGEKFEDAGMQLEAKGKPAKEVYIDD